jgi:hypothetical protein
MRKIERISIGGADRERLERLVRDRNTPQKVVWRARIVLLANDGLTAEAIAAAVGQEPADGSPLAPPPYGRGGRGAFEGRDPALARQAAAARDDQASGGHDAARETAECDPMERSQHGGGGRHLLAQRPADLGCARLKPHLVKTFKISRDKNFAGKVEDVVGLYLNPPNKALVLCVDEKSQIQALDRTQPGLPMKKGRARTMTHDYKRNGTTTLFAALNMLDGSVIGTCMPRHRHREFLRFLKLIDQRTPAGLALHLIVDKLCHA